MITTSLKVSDVRKLFLDLKERKEYVIDKTGCQMLEVIGATFVADEDAIFGKVNHDYVRREIEWYSSMSCNVNDIPPPIPAAWKACASPTGEINSNYGHLIWSAENNFQYKHVERELRSNPDSRRAVMIYTRPTIWDEFNRNGMSDFICTNAVQYLIRPDAAGEKKVHAVVQMRSNDAVFGYKNDFAWAKYVLSQLAEDLKLPAGDIIWHAGSLHVYSRHFDLVVPGENT